MPEAKTPERPARGARFGAGFKAPFEGIGQWLKTPGLRKAGLPALGIGLGLTAVIGAAWITQLSTAHAWLAEKQASGALSLSWWAVSPSLALGGICLGVFLLVVLGNLFASPWQHRLVRAAEQALGAAPREPPATPVSLSDAMLAELKRLAWLAGWLLLGLVLGLVPLLGALLYTLWFWCVLTIYLASIFIGLPLAGRGVTGWSKARFIWRHKVSLLGFGLGLMLLAVIPVLQATCLPAAAVGAVGLVHQLRRAE